MGSTAPKTHAGGGAGPAHHWTERREDQEDPLLFFGAENAADWTYRPHLSDQGPGRVGAFHHAVIRIDSWRSYWSGTYARCK